MSAGSHAYKMETSPALLLEQNWLSGYFKKHTGLVRECPQVRNVD